MVTMDWSYSREFRTPLFEYSLSSVTTKEQLNTEKLVDDVYFNQKEVLKENYLKLYKLIHIIFCKSNLYQLPESYESLDASQTWLIFWNVHSLRLLNFNIPDDLKSGIIKDLQACQNPTGGFGGGPYQVSHMATTYASVMTLVELQSNEALGVVNKTTLYNWLMGAKLENGAFAMHIGGELDVRGCYCAVAVASIMGITSEALFANTAKWIASCQTYEGGFAGIPGSEAHGGYTFCALAALILLNGVHLIDLKSLLRWTVNRQMSLEGGFQGRTNKLVDSCYTYWVGALLPLIRMALMATGENEFSLPLFDVAALEEYVIVCCQRLSAPYHNPNGGGLIDKPGKKPDPYHTCYGLSGLAVIQSYQKSLDRCCLGAVEHNNELTRIDPIFNVCHEALEFCYRFNAE